MDVPPLAIFHVTTDAFRLCGTPSDAWEHLVHCSCLCFPALRLLQVFLAPQEQETLWVAGQPEKSLQESETESISLDQWVTCFCVLCSELFQCLVNKNLLWMRPTSVLMFPPAKQKAGRDLGSFWKNLVRNTQLFFQKRRGSVWIWLKQGERST